VPWCLGGVPYLLKASWYKSIALLAFIFGQHFIFYIFIDGNLQLNHYFKSIDEIK